MHRGHPGCGAAPRRSLGNRSLARCLRGREEERRYPQVAARCRIESGDLFGGLPLDTRFGIVVSNPPYVAQAELGGLQAEVQREPRLALDGGPDGLAVIRRVIDESQDRLELDGLLAMEIGETQGTAVRALLLEAGYADVRIEQDLEKRERMAFGARP
jgi:release factor glutamine methyltransferase